jgi:S-DNA-T family DNA segregation ATPase FtsK/SpoIIIE
MAKKRRKKNLKKSAEKIKSPSHFALPEETKRWIGGVVMIVLAIIITLGFFNLAGVAGQGLIWSLNFLIGRVVFITPLILVFGGLVFFLTKYKRFLAPSLLAIFISIIGICGVMAALTPEEKGGGWIGYIFSWPLLNFFGFWVNQIIFGAVIIIGALIFWQLLKVKVFPKEALKAEVEKKPSLIKKIFMPKFKVKEIPLQSEERWRPSEKTGKIEPKSPALEYPSPIKVSPIKYEPPPIDLLEEEKGTPAAGDVRVNSAIIKKTLENFDIPVEMSEINIGPTVTQYTFKPAEGIKLSKITALSNDLSLALASHPIRIEAPVPGKAVVGIEIPNKIRAQVRLRDLISSPNFQRAISNLTFVLGRDVSGNPVYADLAKMPHLLVAGSTGTGKTIFLNSLILSLLYKNSPETLRFILVDPKRVEFPIYNDLPHLLSPVIFDPQKSINALKWLISEMERRFDLLSVEKARDINNYNEVVFKNKATPLPYIVFIIDELADLMAARGREIEAGIVRLAQMSRAVGIHLVVATQRPSVEVITGLIKANITSRVTFQVASQVDSRTVLDVAGAEKLLGSGDLLFISAEIAKPKRIQGAYVLEKEVKKIINYLKEKGEREGTGAILPSESELAENLEKRLAEPESELEFSGEEDPLYEEAKKAIIESRKASASLLQRRLRIGYARAARLIDRLEEKGVVGPGEGAKPREVYLPADTETEEEDNGWKKI